jgi:hypothetical protein
MKPFIVRMDIMPSVLVQVVLAIGGLGLVGALYLWLRGKREGSRWRRWQSVTSLAFSLFVLFFAVAMLVGPPMGGVWYALMVVAGLLTMGAAYMGLLTWTRERQGEEPSQNGSEAP